MIVELLSVAYGIASMIGYGLSDFLSKRVVGGVGYYRLVTYTQLVALAPVILISVMYTPHVPSSLTSIALVIASGVCSFSALFFFYKGLEAGKASIIAPVFSAYAIVAIVLSFVVFGEVLSLLQIVCIAVTLIGVLTITVRSNYGERSNAGIPYALGSMLSAGLGAVLIKLVSDDVGEISSLFFNRVIAVLTLAAVGALFLRSHLRSGVRGGFPVKSIVLIGLAEFAAFFSFVVGVSVGMVSLVATLSSASPAVTVVLAQAFLRERLVRVHKFAVVLVIVGILFLSITST
jgi:drug/metabolite transporter (DMT)-like permease